jgi:hypothetical protein
MKKYILLSTSILIMLLVSCKKETKVPVSGTITLSSQLMGDGPYYTHGFSFLTGAIHKYPGEQVDLLVLALKTTSGDVDGAVFEAANDYSGSFNNTYYNLDLGLAETQFNNYSEVTATNFKAVTDSIMEGQIITYKSPGNKYAKILIQNFNIVIQGNEQYAQVTISWVFQPNGTTKF